MNFINTRSGRLSSCVLVLTTLAASSFGQKLAPSDSAREIKNVESVISAPNSVVEPVVFDSNISCADLNALHQNGSGDIRFSHILTNWGLKLNFADPNGTYPFTNGDGRVVVGTEFPARSITISSSSNPGLVSSWGANLPITAVNVKVGNTSYVYPYKPFRFTDTNLATGDNRGISHVTICYGEPTGTTAGEVSVTGRVVEASGRGIPRAQMVLINGATGESKITLTNSFGYYTFTGLDVNEVYVLNVASKRYSSRKDNAPWSLLMILSLRTLLPSRSNSKTQAARKRRNARFYPRGGHSY